MFCVYRLCAGFLAEQFVLTGSLSTAIDATDPAES